MKRDFNPVDVELSIENPSIERGAFYRLCFITESNIAPRTLKVTRLQDLLDNGYSRLDLAYNFCVGVFSQQGIDTVYIRAKRSYESYVEAYNSDDNSMYYFVVLQTKDLTEVEKFNSHLVSSDEMKLQFFSQNVGSKTLKSPKLVNYYQDYIRPEGGVSSDGRDFYLNSAYEGLITQIKLSLPDYLLSGLGDIAIDYGIYNMTGKKQIWEIDKAGRRIRYATQVLQQGWVGSKEESTVNGSDITAVAYRGSDGVSKKSTVLNPKVKIETLSRELLKGLGKEVLDYAVPLIDPEAKDWVLDPANNAVKYKNPDYAAGGDNSNKLVHRAEYNADAYFSTPVAACRDGLVKINGDRPTGQKFTYVSASTSNGICKYKDYDGSAFTLPLTSKGNPNYVVGGTGSSSQEFRSISLDTVAAKIISNADAGHLESKEFLKSIPLFAYLLTGSGTEAVNKAVLDIDPEATDWVLDPESNRIKYKPVGGVGAGGVDSDGQFGYVVGSFQEITYTTKEAACSAFVARQNSLTSDTIYVNTGVVNKDCQVKGSPVNGAAPVNFIFPIQYIKQAAPIGGGVDSDGYKYLPIDTVAAKVISNAETGHTPSQEALRLSTVEKVNTGEYDEALEAASTEIDTSWKYLPIYDVAVQVKRNSIAGHAESIEAVNNSLPFELPDNDTPWAYVQEQTSVSGSTTNISAKRTFKNKKLKSKISVAASASEVGKHLIKGGGSAAIAYAMVELAVGALDWVLNPTNNSVKVTYPATDGSAAGDGTCASTGWSRPTNLINGTFFASPEGACRAIAAITGKAYKSFTYSSDTSGMCYLQGDQWSISKQGDCSAADPSFTPSGNGSVVNIPIATVAAKVISNAEAGHTPSQEAIKATALEGFAAGEYNAALDAAAVLEN